mgnify:CR=1 FL=1|tara:strand:- start:6992 stop:7723 length:732 start_codon:yes stop_codon:yes gene_type:complete
MATRYSARFEGVTLIERDAANVISVSIERANAAPTIASATFSLIDPNGIAVIDAQVATIAAGVVSYTIGSTVLAAEEYGQRWLVKFAVTIGSAVYTYYNDAAVCLARLSPPVTHADITARHGDITNLLPTGTTSTQGYIDAAWIEITGELYSDAVPFWTLRTVSALRQPLIMRSLTLIFRDFTTLVDSSDKYEILSDKYEKQAQVAMSKLRGFFDRGEADTVDGERKPTAGLIQLSASRRRQY